MDAGFWATAGGAGAALLSLLVAALRKRVRAGKRIMPRVRVRTYFSFRTPESEPPPHELEATDVEIIDTRPDHFVPPPRERDDFDERNTTRPTPRDGKRK